MKIHVALFASFIMLMNLTSCETIGIQNKMGNVGMLLPDTIDDQVWNSKGYKGLLNIASTHQVDVFYKEEVETKAQMREALDEFLSEDVTLVFGHGNIYADFFSDLKNEYPSMDFVTFNGDAEGKDFTSFHFKGEAMGYFGGRIAAEMTETEHIGIIAAFPWQPEVDGFKRGALTQNPLVNVHIDFVDDWGDEDKAAAILSEFVQKGVDVFYPAGDGFNVPLIQEIKREGLYAIGYVADQIDLGQETILTSTVQDVERLYLIAAEQYSKNELKTGNIYVDFDSGAILLGEFSPLVPEEFKAEITEAIKDYIETGKLSETP